MDYWCFSVKKGRIFVVKWRVPCKINFQSISSEMQHSKGLTLSFIQVQNWLFKSNMFIKSTKKIIFRNFRIKFCIYLQTGSWMCKRCFSNVMHLCLHTYCKGLPLQCRPWSFTKLSKKIVALMNCLLRISSTLKTWLKLSHWHTMMIYVFII